MGHIQDLPVGSPVVTYNGPRKDPALQQIMNITALKGKAFKTTDEMAPVRCSR